MCDAAALYSSQGLVILMADNTINRQPVDTFGPRGLSSRSLKELRHRDFVDNSEIRCRQLSP